MTTEGEILSAVDQRIVELGTEGAKNLIDGKQEDEQIEVLDKLITLKGVYSADIDQKEKESVLYCLKMVSEKFVQPAIKNSGGLNLPI
jgi:hypothetical protein